ncbi:recombinase family protein [Aliiroseovarius sp.]|uniref:recombinase family protein n=1 Tax=Aliiroseovarius sp. TaxID=1872442 RepID=UPI003BAD78D5
MTKLPEFARILLPRSGRRGDDNGVAIVKECCISEEQIFDIGSARIFIIDLGRSKIAVQEFSISAVLNDRSGDSGCNASISVPRPRTDAASANTKKGNGGKVITVLGMVADMELKFIRDRQRAGIEAAKGKGLYKGRRKSVDDNEIRRLAREGTPKAQIARDLGVSRMTVYRALADAET